MNSDLEIEIWSRFSRGESLQSAGLGSANGLLDLRGLHAPGVSVAESTRTALADVAEVGGGATIRGVQLDSIDFSRSRLCGIRWENCSVTNCVFDECRCQDWRLWGTSFVNTTFRSADLRGSALGAVTVGKRNTFHGVDFTDADLRGTVYKSAEFIRCLFNQSRLDKVDFQGSTFSGCTFVGELKEVMFYRRAYGGDALPENTMKNVDFTRATFRFVALRGLDLLSVKFPQDDDHIVLRNYPQTLDRILEMLQTVPDVPKQTSAVLTCYLSDLRKWAGSNQTCGVLSPRDLEETIGIEAADQFSKLVRSLSATDGSA